MVLGRLTVDRRFQGQQIGQALLRDAILRTLQASKIAGIKAILVHAISEDAKQFYLRHGFVESPFAAMTLYLALDTARHALAANGEPKPAGSFSPFLVTRYPSPAPYASAA